MKLEVYTTKWAKEKLEKYLSEKLNNKFIVKIDVYTGSVPNKCMECAYFPECEENCSG